MATPLAAIIVNLKRVDLAQSALGAVREQIHLALDYNTESQLYERGIDADGNSLGEYTPFTVETKRRKGQPTDRVTLKDEGDFHRGFFATTDKFPIVFGSSDPKADMLEDKYGNIFGLTTDNKKAFVEDIKPYIVDNCRKALIASLH